MEHAMGAPVKKRKGLIKALIFLAFVISALGLIRVGTFIFTFFIGTIKEVWSSSNWAELISFKVFFSIALFVFSFFIPKLIKKFKGEA